MSNKFVREARKQFKAREGASLGGLEAQVVGEELERIRSEHGQLDAPVVVNEARPEDALLHGAFEWDDTKAGEEYRKSQARRLIRSVQVITPESGESRTVYVSVKKTDGERTYQPIDVVVQHADQYASAVMEAQSRINSARRALEDLRAAAGASEMNEERLATIHLAATALATAYSAVEALH
jgi:hypothetical protein